MRETFTKSIDALPTIFAFTEEFFTAENIGDAHRYAVNFAVEELFTNMVKYNRESCHDILLVLERKDGRMTGSLTDFEVAPFDVTKTPEVDVEAPAEARRVGGLGLYLIPKMVDTLDYVHRDGNSTITFTKQLGLETDVGNRQTR